MGSDQAKVSLVSGSSVSIDGAELVFLLACSVNYMSKVPLEISDAHTLLRTILYKYVPKFDVDVVRFIETLVRFLVVENKAEYGHLIEPWCEVADELGKIAGTVRNESLGIQ